MEFKIENTEVFGLEKSLVASGNSFRTTMRPKEDLNDKDIARCEKLGSVAVGSGHDAFLNGINVIADFTAPLYWWKQAQRYHWFEFVSSQSTMHCVTKFKLEERCTKDVDPRIIKIIQEKIDNYNQVSAIILDYDNAPQGEVSIDKESYVKNKERLWHEIIASLPCGFCLSATMTTNYRQLKTMCQQRKGHHLAEWKTFIDWCCTLPRFSELTGVAL